MAKQADRMTDEQLSKQLGRYQATESIGILLGVLLVAAGCITMFIRRDPLLICALGIALTQMQRRRAAAWLIMAAATPLYLAQALLPWVMLRFISTRMLYDARRRRRLRRASCRRFSSRWRSCSSRLTG